MTIQDLGSLGELIAALATVATIAYLAVQIRQNTAVVRTSNYSELTSRTADVAKQIAGDPELMDIWQRGLQDYRGLSERDQGRFHMVISQFFVTWQLMMQLHSRGLVDGEFFEQQLGGFGELFKSPGVQQWWSTEKRWYSAGYRDFIDRNHAEPAAQQGAAADRQGPHSGQPR
jgi:hypothetical protein